MDEELEYLVQQIVSKRKELSDEIDEFLHRMSQADDEIAEALRRARQTKRLLDSPMAHDAFIQRVEGGIITSDALIAYDDALSHALDSVDESAASALSFASRMHSLSERFDRRGGIAGVSRL